MNHSFDTIYKKADWTSPSNIALIKYWGKHGNQLPSNPSLSFSLSVASTRMLVSVVGKGSPASNSFYFGGYESVEFQKRIEKFLSEIVPFFPFLSETSLKIESWNSFPHSAGIASSASAFSALALCLCELSLETSFDETYKEEFFRKASQIARIGSGSASRSVYGGFNTWGKSEIIENSSDEWASNAEFEIHPAFKNLQDTILIVSSEKKKISSSAGHSLMNTHPYAKERFILAAKNLKVLINSLKTGNISEFVQITENEALGLHSLMMSSDPGFTLLKPETLEIINRIVDFRQKSGFFLCFTLDAGPNIHLIYPEGQKNDIQQFINDELLKFCENGKALWDECGTGPSRNI